MEHYKHILVAVDLSDTSKEIIQRAHKMSLAFECKLSIMQSHENFPIDIPPDGIVFEDYNKDEWFKDHACKALRAMTDSLEINNPEIHPTVGFAKDEIIGFAKKNNVDLIVIGSHERHGLALLFNSRTDGIVHAAPCDVLAVHC